MAIFDKLTPKKPTKEPTIRTDVQLNGENTAITPKTPRTMTVPTVENGGGMSILRNPTVNDNNNNGKIPDYDGFLKGLNKEEEQAQQEEETSQYDYLRQTSAKDLLDANVATQIANQVALKNAESTLASMGLNNTGYAGSYAAEIGNAANAQLAQNREAYQKAMRDIDLAEYNENKEKQAEADEILAGRFEGVMEYVPSLSGQALDSYLERNGFTYNSETGMWEHPEYSQAMLEQLNNYILAREGSTTGTIAKPGESAAGFANAADMVSGITAGTGSGKDIEYEIYNLYAQYPNPQDGFVVKMTNGSDPNKTAYVMYDAKTGTWKQVNSSYYDSVSETMRGEVSHSKEGYDQAKKDTKKSAEETIKKAIDDGKAIKVTNSTLTNEQGQELFANGSINADGTTYYWYKGGVYRIPTEEEYETLKSEVGQAVEQGSINGAWVVNNPFKQPKEGDKVSYQGKTYTYRNGKWVA